MQRRKKTHRGAQRPSSTARPSAATDNRESDSDTPAAGADASSRSGASTKAGLDAAIAGFAQSAPTRRKGARQTAQPNPQPTALRAQRRRRAHQEAPLAGAPVVEFEGEGTDPLQHEDLSEVAIRSAPAWLVSLIVHTLLLLVLGLLYVSRELPNLISLDATYAERIGAQLDDDSLAADALDPVDVEEPVFSIDSMPANDPLASPPDLERDLQGMMATDTYDAPSVGLALTGREAGMKKALLAAYGGTATTEAAVGRALEWLKRNQRRDGYWSLTGPYSQGATDENRTAATAMALLAFQGAGNTHDSGQYQDQVRKGWRPLLKLQDGNGNFVHNTGADQQLYTQAQVMIALCEIYGMTKDSMFKRPAQRAVDYAVDIQAPEGGWRYQPRRDSDTSVTGWFVMGLQSAMMAGLEVPSPTLQRISKYLDSASMYDGAYYKYQPSRRGYTPAMTAEGLLCRQYLGWKHDDPRLQEGVAFLLDNPIDFGDENSYYWYYATQVMHHMEGDTWDKWNGVMRQAIPSRQVMSGAERGSWPPDNDRWGSFGGRLYHTCLCAYMLEVYYRHLPIYSYRLD